MAKKGKIANKLTSPIALLTSAFRIFFARGNFIFLVTIAIINFLIVLPLGLALGFLLFGKLGSVPNTDPFIYFDRIIANLPLFVFTMLMIALFGAWTKTATIIAIAGAAEGKQMKLIETYLQAFQRTLKYFLASLLLGIFTFIGGILLLVPGIVIYILFSFTLYIVVMTDVGVWASFKKSKNLVWPNFWGVTFRLGVFALFFLLINLIFGSVEYLGIVLLLFSAFYPLPTFLLYRELETA